MGNTDSKGGGGGDKGNGELAIDSKGIHWKEGKEAAPDGKEAAAKKTAGDTADLKESEIAERFVFSYKF